jgi:hypothetical protein
MDDTNKSRKVINSTNGIAFTSGAILAVACQLSSMYMNFVNHLSAFDLTLNNIQISLAGPTTILLLLGVIWGAQRIFRSYYRDPGLSLFRPNSPLTVSGVLAFILGYFITAIFLAVLASLL